MPGCSYPKCNNDPIEGIGLCLGHAPKDQKGVSDDEFIAEINRRLLKGQTNLAGYIFPSDISISLYGHLNSKLVLTNATFHGKATLAGPVFEQAVECSFAKFLGGLDIHNTTFNGGAYFSGAIFRMENERTDESLVLNADHTTFASLVSFKSARFARGRASFNNSRFTGNQVEFAGVRTNWTNLSFANCKFDGIKVDFRYLRLTRSAIDFSQSHFSKCASIAFGSSFLRRSYVNAELTEFEATALNFSGLRARFAEVRLSRSRVEVSEFDFSYCVLLEGRLLLDHLTMNGRHFTLDESKFVNSTFSLSESRVTLAEDLIFTRAQFSGARADFEGCQVTACTVEFIGTHFGTQLHFDRAEFRANSISFRSAFFVGMHAVFNEAKLIGDVDFTHIVIGCNMTFTDMKLQDGSSFHFSRPRFANMGNGWPKIGFLGVKFSPYVTFFEGIVTGPSFDSKVEKTKPLIAFRSCLLRDVYFSENDMTLLSFYTSAYFEDSFFTLSIWDPTWERTFAKLPRLPLLNWRYKRHYRIREEEDYRGPLEREPGVRIDQNAGPKNCQELSELYLRMKSSADKAKDYHRASWFYFSEFEMKRRSIREAIRKDKGVRKLLRWPQYWTYGLYKVLAGYGEKPAWSLMWFGLLSLLFGIVHLFNGYLGEDGAGYCYHIQISRQGFADFASCTFLKDFVWSLFYSISRAIPIGYISGLKLSYLSPPPGVWSDVLSITNSIVLALLLVFFGVGLKRHFRRF